MKLKLPPDPGNGQRTATPSEQNPGRFGTPLSKRLLPLKSPAGMKRPIDR